MLFLNAYSYKEGRKEEIIQQRLEKGRGEPPGPLLLELVSGQGARRVGVEQGIKRIGGPVAQAPHHAAVLVSGEHRHEGVSSPREELGRGRQRHRNHVDLVLIENAPVLHRAELHPLEPPAQKRRHLALEYEIAHRRTAPVPDDVKTELSRVVLGR